MRIALLANLKDNAPTWDGMPDDQWDDLDGHKTIDAILDALKGGGHHAEFLEASILQPFDLVGQLLKYKPDLCFNIAEGHWGDSRETQIPSILEMLRLPYTGSKLLALSLALDKPMTKRVLYYHGLPTPEFQTFEAANEPIDADLLDDDNKELRYPLFVKPSREGTSVGITADSVVNTKEELREQITKQLERYDQPILAEHFVKGRELTVGMVGNLDPSKSARRVNERAQTNVLPDTLHFFPALEVNMEKYDDSEKGVYTNKIKVELADEFHWLCPAPIDADFEHELRLLAGAVFRVIGCKDIARVDFRLDERQNNKPYILEVNPLPGLNPIYSDLAIEAKAGGWPHEKLINTIVDLAAKRQGIKAS